MIKFLNNCCQNQQPVEIIYMDGAGRLSRRIIFVKRIEGKRITAYCTLRQDLRTFHLEGILAAQRFIPFQPPAQVVGTCLPKVRKYKGCEAR